MDNENYDTILPPGIPAEEVNRRCSEEREGTSVFGVSRHRLGRDGKGITTLVTFHGCPLHCKYCLNEQCYEPADRFPHYTPERLYAEVKQDDLYFRATDGGVTFGGGEPAQQADFIVRFRELCGEDWKIRLETSLNVDKELIEKLAPIVDEWIVDIKTDDQEVYQKYTRGSRNQALMNLHYLTSEDGLNVSPECVFLRVPIIPGFVSKEEAEKTAETFRNTYPNVEVFEYITDVDEKKKREENDRKTGKEICELLKAVRREIAEKHGIDLRESECTNEGDCPGTCPRCEYELGKLNTELRRKGVENTEISEELKERLDNFHRVARDEEQFIELGHMMEIRDDFHLDGDAKPWEPWEPEYRYKQVFFKECPIAGLSFHLEKDDELWDELEEGVKLALVRQKDNKHDRNAVAVCLADDYDGDPDDFDFDFILGYIPRSDNAELAAMMDAGYADKFSAEITTYKRHGNYNDRIRITIYIQSSEKEMVRPDLMRMQSLDFVKWRDMIDELRRRGTIHFRWGGFPIDEHNLPIVGERIAFVHEQEGCVYMMLTRVLAEGDACRPFLDDPDEVDMVDDCCTFVLTNVCGPIWTGASRLKFMDLERTKFHGYESYLSRTEDVEVMKIFRSRLNHFRRNNIDEDPSLDEPKNE